MCVRKPFELTGIPLEPNTLQHKDEICLSVNAEKLFGLGNQQGRLE